MKIFWVAVFLVLCCQSHAWRGSKKTRPPPSLFCDPVKCEGNCREILGSDRCPRCICDPLCSPPKCPPGCKIETDFKGPCPGCDCGQSDEDIDIKCDPVKCTRNCREALGRNGCPTCLCDPLCSPPKCEPGCEIEIEFEGPCPGCKCDGDKGGSLTKALCDPVKCGPNCRETTGPFGCPTCLCGPLCSPPKCEPGCEIETEFDGPCPGCKCDGGKGILDLKKPLCDPVKCGPNCREATSGPFGCPTCLCGPLCSPPKCDPGCEIEIEFKGPCPGCKCDGGKEIGKPDLAKALCDPVKCLGNCREALGSSGCPMCLCDPLCSPPKCPPGCEVQTVFDGPCPGCDCKKDEDIKLKCPPVEECFKPGCSKKVDELGCETCVCGPVCDPPKCRFGCRLQPAKPPNPCPTCVCVKPWSKGHWK